MVGRSFEADGGADDARDSRRLLGAALLGAALAFIALKYLGTINGWKLTHWLFSYDLGFVRRGAVGTLVSFLSPDGVVPLRFVVIASLGVASLFLAALAALAWPAFADPLQRRRGLAVGVFALAAPGYGFLLSDLGRFDVLNYALVLIALVTARARGRFPYPLFLALAGLLLVIHEAALLLAVPVLFVSHLDANDRLGWLAERGRWPTLAARGAPVIALFALITVHGSADATLRELMAQLSARGDFAPSARSAYVLIRELDSNLAQVMGWETRVALARGMRGPPLGPIQIEPFLGILPFALAQLAIAHAVLRGIAGVRRRGIVLASYLCFLAPLPLLLVGIDWGRWVALASAHCATLTLYFAPELPDEREAPFSARAAIVLAAFVILSASASYTMAGARWGSAESPRVGVARWRQDMRLSPTWDRAFVTP